MTREHTPEYLEAVVRRLKASRYPKFLIDDIIARSRGEAGGRRRKPKQDQQPPTPQEGEDDGNRTSQNDGANTGDGPAGDGEPGSAAA